MDVKIRVYYHVSFLNHWEEITEYIFKKIVGSGLYDHIEGIFIGALGETSQLSKLDAIISKYPKAKLVEHSERLATYEMHTIRHLKKDADMLPKFYGLYLHSKSCTFPKEGIEGIEGRTPDAFKFDWYWMQFMTWGLVEQWKRWYKALDMKYWGYDIASVRVVPARCSASTRTHGSGNFNAVNSEYVKTLDKEKFVYSDWCDKFESEMILWSGNPITYVISNMFCEGFPIHIPFHEYMANFKELDAYASP